MKTYVVRKPFTIGCGSTTRNPNPSRGETLPVGAAVTLVAEAPNGNVWLSGPDGTTGRIQCGSVANLLRDGRLEVVEQGEGAS